MENIDEQLEKETKAFINRLGKIFGSTKAKKKDDETNDDDSEKLPDFITSDQFDDFRRGIIELLAAMNNKVNEIVKVSSSKSDDEEEDDEEETVKASSKSIPVHDNGAKSQPQSDSSIVYSIMGRDSTGSTKKQ